MSFRPTSSVFREISLLGSLVLPMLLWSQPAGTAFQERLPIDTVDLPFTALTINDGLSQGMVNMVAQDDQGFLWFATKDGLNRYDGYSFRVFRHDPSDSSTVRESTITCVYFDPAGRLWVGTSSGLDLFDRYTERFQHVPIRTQRSNWGGVTMIEMDLNGSLYVATTGALFRLDPTAPFVGDALPPFVTTWLGDTWSTVSQTRDGVLWGSSGSMAFRARPQHGGGLTLDTLEVFPYNERRFHLQGLIVVEDTVRGKLYGISVNGIVDLDRSTGQRTILYTTPDLFPDLQAGGPRIDPEGRIWLATYNGLFRFDPASRRMEIIRTADPDMRNLSGAVKWSFIDRSGLLWVGTSGYGILKYDPRIQRFNTWHDGSIRALVPSRDGTVIVTRYAWFLCVFDPKKRAYVRLVKNASDLDWDVAEQQPTQQSDLAIQDDEGIYWIASADLLRYDAERGTLEGFRASMFDDTARHHEGSLFPILQARDGTLWAGGDSALYRFDRSTRKFTPFRYTIPTTNNPYPFVTSLQEGTDGSIWAGTLRGVLRLDPRTGSWKHFAHDPDNARSLPVEIAFSIALDPDDAEVVWVGTNGGGLSRLDARTGDVESWSTREGLPNDVLYGALFDNAGQLWVSTNKGLSRFDRRTKTFRNFSVGDGLQSDEFNRHAYCKDAQGRLWFGGVSGFSYFDPEVLEEDSTPVTVRITGIKLMNKQVVFGSEGSPLAKPVHLSVDMEIPYSANMVTFSFAAMEFAMPGLHQYRYKLEGFDPEWIDAGSDNSAIYTNLDPGTYTFRVRGRNRDGIWDVQGTSFMLTVHPPWWRTWWFFTLCGLVGIGGTLFYIRSLRRQKVHLEKMVSTRTQELSREKDRSEELLKNILPVNVAAELKLKGHTEARHFEQVTVLFSDFKEFTLVTEQLTPTDLVEELNVCFNAFDRIMEKYGIEKIKTIGDAYMAAGGVPDPSGGMPLAVVHAGLEMQAIMVERQVERKAQGKVAFFMRLGIHTGPVVAGVVGRRKFQYDIWGDTVNIASRMETTGEVGEVNISEATYTLVKDEPGLHFTARGKVQAKGKGELEMYYVRHASSSARTDLERHVSEAATHVASIVQVPIADNTQLVTRQHETELRNLRILLVDDNNFNLLVAQSELEHLVPGVRVDVAENGAIAVDRVKQNAYDLVLMDVQMPVMDGYQATRAIRALPKDRSRVPIIALTANVMQAEVERCKEAGMDDFVPKPFKRAQLMEAIERVVAKTHGA